MACLLDMDAEAARDLEEAEVNAIHVIAMFQIARYGAAAVLRSGALAHDDPQFPRIVFSDSCSARLTTSQRFHATGSINSSMAPSTQSRRSLGSIASSSQ